jgi:hypothetical protein
MKVGVSSQADILGELAEFASHPLWRNIFEELSGYSEDLKTAAASSAVIDFAYTKGQYHGALNTVRFLQSVLEKYKGTKVNG